MNDLALSISNLNKSFGGVRATDDVSLEIRTGELHALIGPNGAGKTTLISQLSGLLPADSGTVIFNGRDITRLPAHEIALAGLARSFQITSIFADMTVLDNVAMAVQAQDGHSFRFWRPARKDQRLREPAMQCLQRVGLADRASSLASAVSHGERRQLEIAMALATSPQMLLLDEPMAGMGPEESGRMIDIMQSLRGEKTMLLVEHDMDAVFALADRITVLVYGRVIASGNPDDIRANADVRRAYLGEDAE
jgi:branched-chain amino acid transport system ATP-binding protein